MSDPRFPTSDTPEGEALGPRFPSIHHHYHYHETPGADLVAEVRALATQVSAIGQQVTDTRNVLNAVLPTLINSLNQTRSAITHLEETMAADLSRITSEVTEIGDASDAAVSLLGSLAQMVRDLSTDPVALNALADELDAKGTALAAAVVENTPAAPEPEPEPEPEV